MISSLKPTSTAVKKTVKLEAPIVKFYDNYEDLMYDTDSTADSDTEIEPPPVKIEDISGTKDLLADRKSVV